MKRAMAAALAVVALGVAGVLAHQAQQPRLASGIDVTAFDTRRRRTCAPS